MFKKNLDQKYYFIMEKIGFEKNPVTFPENSFRGIDISFVNSLQRKYRFAKGISNLVQNLDQIKKVSELISKMRKDFDF